MIVIGVQHIRPHSVVGQDNVRAYQTDFSYQPVSQCVVSHDGVILQIPEFDIFDSKDIRRCLSFRPAYCFHGLRCGARLLP